jgi:hypothetical protein
MYIAAIERADMRRAVGWLDETVGLHLVLLLALVFTTPSTRPALLFHVQANILTRTA